MSGWRTQAVPSAKRRVYVLNGLSQVGNEVFYVVDVVPAKEARFLKDMESNLLEPLDHYGEILARGYGNEPDEATKAYLREHYDCDI